MYGDSQALLSSDDSNMPIILPTNPNPKEEHFPLLMESHYSSSSSSQSNSGLLRFRSAPTSLLSNFTTTTGAEKTSSARFCSASNEENSIHVVDSIGDKSCDKGSSGSNRFSAMNSQLPPQYPRQSGGGGGGGGGGGFSLLRQNSSPAELLSHLTAQNGYNTGVRGIGSYRMADIGGANGDLISPSSSTRLSNHTNLSSSSLGLLSRITEVENENGGPHIPNYAKVAGHDNLFSTASGFPFGSWNDSSYFAETFTTSGIKTEVDSDPKPIFLTENEELIRNRPSSYTLSHHLSLPKSTTSSEMSNIEKLLHLQDSVPCKVRAKRGCATHPRSIAERVRRTRISERMRKLQELVPNMDKQTNTADMLDLAVEYIKSLQKQYKILGDNRANCKCSASQKVHLNRTH